MDDDLCQDAILDRQQLEEEVAIEAQKWQEREDREARIAAWEQDYLKQFGCWPDDWMYEEIFNEDVEAGLVDPPTDEFWMGVLELERRYGRDMFTMPINRPVSVW